MINLQTAAEQHTCKLKGSRLDTLLKKMLRSDLVTNLGKAANESQTEARSEGTKNPRTFSEVKRNSAAISGVQLLPTIVPQWAKFNYTEVSEGHTALIGPSFGAPIREKSSSWDCE